MFALAQKDSSPRRGMTTQEAMLYAKSVYITESSATV